MLEGCGGDLAADGWYAELFALNTKSIEFDPTIADVHTQPTDEGGNDLGRVLHVATSMPELMVVTVDNCAGAQACRARFDVLRASYRALRAAQRQGMSTRLSEQPPPRPAWLPDAFAH